MSIHLRFGFRFVKPRGASEEIGCGKDEFQNAIFVEKMGCEAWPPGRFFFVPKIGLDLPFLEGKPMVNKPIIIRSAISGRGKGRGPGG